MKLLVCIVWCTILLWLTPQSLHGQDELSEADYVHLTNTISSIMSDHIYNPSELKTSRYGEMKHQMMDLAVSSKTTQDYIDGFNRIWDEGPFSHVSLQKSNLKAAEMADYIDALRVGDKGMRLEWRDKTPILTINTMMGVDTYDGIIAAYEEINERKVESLIIDLRNNPGGTFAIVPLIGYLIDEPLDAGMFVSRKWWSNNQSPPRWKDVETLTPWKGWSIKSFWQDVQDDPVTRVQFLPMGTKFRGLVYVLTNANSASATEFMVDAVYDLENVTVIGGTTAGEMLSQKMFDLPFGLQISVPIAEYYSLRIGRIEGKGIKPHVGIDPDLAMEEALRMVD